MATLKFEMLVAASDAFRQERDLLEEVVNPYIRMLSEVTHERIPHATIVVEQSDVHKMIVTSGLLESTNGDVFEWVQREVWNTVKRNNWYVI
jgi:hypothetical protein